MKKELTKFSKIWQEKCGTRKRLPHSLPAVDRIIVIGDIHGDLKLLYKFLRLTNPPLIDSEGNWNGKDTVVVQVGDQIDRCRINIEAGLRCYQPETTLNDEDSDVQILEYLTKLHNQAQLEGGAVYSLLGNHELMNVKGNMSYVSFKGLVNFSQSGSVEEGMANRIKLFEPGSKYANFLGCTRQSVLIIGSNIFVHGGIVKDLAKKYKVKDINKIVSMYLFNELEDPEKYYDLLEHPQICPFWTRFYSGFSGDYNQFSPDINKQFCKELDETLKIYDVNNVIVGHTAQINTGINSNCSNKVHFVDVGASDAFGNIPNAPTRKAQVLEILNDNIFNII
jgi:hypothetical protein